MPTRALGSSRSAASSAPLSLSSAPGGTTRYPCVCVTGGSTTCGAVGSTAATTSAPEPGSVVAIGTCGVSGGFARPPSQPLPQPARTVSHATRSAALGVCIPPVALHQRLVDSVGQ